MTKARKKTICGFSFVVFYRNVPQGCIWYPLPLSALSIWISFKAVKQQSS